MAQLQGRGGAAGLGVAPTDDPPSFLSYLSSCWGPEEGGEQGGAVSWAP